MQIIIDFFIVELKREYREISMILNENTKSEVNDDDDIDDVLEEMKLD